jgi:hypothetical protein
MKTFLTTAAVALGMLTTSFATPAQAGVYVGIGAQPVGYRNGYYARPRAYRPLPPPIYRRPVVVPRYARPYAYPYGYNGGVIIGAPGFGFRAGW